MSTDTADERTEQSLRAGGVPTRQRIEEVLLVLTALLGIGMIGFVTVDWLRAAPGTVGTFTGTAFAQFLILGEWLDYYLGTNVFQHPFMWRQIATGVLVGIVGPLVGTYLVHRQMALIGETLAHTAFAGVAIGVVVVGLFGLAGSRGQLLVVALIVSVAAALGLQWLTQHTDSYGDVPIAIVLTGSFAVGTLLISWGREFVSVPIEIEDLLFGNMSVVTAQGSQIVAVLSVVVTALVVFNYKQFLFITFDEKAARVARFNVSWYNALLVTMTAVVVVGAMQILGVILVAGLLVIPVAAASQVAGGFRETLYLSVLFGQASILGGIGFAIWASLPSGGSVIVVAILIYLIAVAFSDRSATLTMR
ncbi:metal ABC transporter permease [Natranaeroarchaeum sulfidigenes]|uniref:ABC-type Mn2+/Zn2+ transport system, permease component n=1 Tax=Natranaeroarchaeum sulfidigenes TaxID=2784880 RepID=A0A897MT73_9EURY|nr:metal ABC transporter permease [Natranaeroarchaeum sulfidigenes]QSG02233.1 ABC-type Mn2+/Zn2+ transport system, permease component [Natranaeroarchaeum sulfidigenes]